MDLNIADQIKNVLEWLLGVVSSLGFILPIAMFLVINLFTDRKKKNKEHPESSMTPPQTSAPQPASLPGIPGLGPMAGDLFGWLEPEADQPPKPARHRQDDPFRRDDETLKWESAFAANDSEKETSAFRWGSVFDNDAERPKWGWDATEWGGDYAPKPNSEPQITVG